MKYKLKDFINAHAKSVFVYLYRPIGSLFNGLEVTEIDTLEFDWLSNVYPSEFQEKIGRGNRNKKFDSTIGNIRTHRDWFIEFDGVKGSKFFYSKLLENVVYNTHFISDKSLVLEWPIDIPIPPGLRNNTAFYILRDYNQFENSNEFFIEYEYPKNKEWYELGNNLARYV